MNTDNKCIVCGFKAHKSRRIEIPSIEQGIGLDKICKGCAYAITKEYLEVFLR